MQGGGQADAVSRAPALDESLARAHQLAVSQGHGTVALEHLLFALTDDADAVSILGASRISVEQLRIDVSGHLGRMSETAPPDAGAAPRPGADLLRILQLAGMAARQSQRRLMDGGIVLAAIIGDGNSPAAGLLKAHGLTFEDVIRVLQTAGAPRQQEIASPPPRASLPPPTPSAPKPQARPEPARPEPARPEPARLEAAPAEPARDEPAREAVRPSVGGDALAAARSRVRQSEPQAMKPLVPVSMPLSQLAPPPEPQAAPVQNQPPPASPPPARPDRQPPQEPLRPDLVRPDLVHPEPARPEQRPLEQPRPAAASEPTPGPRREVTQPLVQPDPNRSEPDRLEATRPRAASLEPIAVPAEAPAVEQPLARLRSNPSHTPAPYPQAMQPPPQRPAVPQYPHPRPVPAVAPRPPAPYPYAPPPGPRSPQPVMPQRADASALSPQLSAQQALPPHAVLPSEPLEIVHAAAGLPAVVRRNVPVLVEIRIPRSQVDVPRHGPFAASGVPVLRAVTTRLTGGPVSGLSIEPRTPETTWLGPAEADNRDVIWQYVLLPTRAGTFAVTLSVSGRTVTPNGMITDASTAAETFAVRVKPERGRFSRRLFSTLVLLALGGAIGWALTGPLAGLVKALIDVARG